MRHYPPHRQPGCPPCLMPPLYAPLPVPLTAPPPAVRGILCAVIRPTADPAVYPTAQCPVPVLPYTYTPSIQCAATRPAAEPVWPSALPPACRPAIRFTVYAPSYAPSYEGKGHARGDGYDSRRTGKNWGQRCVHTARPSVTGGERQR